MSLEAVLIAGANGAGKTTFARQFLQVQFPTTPFLNVDEIQREARAFAHPIAAGKELLRRVEALEAQGQSFAIETTLSSRMYARHIPVWANQGYRITLHFIEVPSADFAVHRVAIRVAAGGHPVSEADVRRRFQRGLELFGALYKGLVHEWNIGTVMKEIYTLSIDMKKPEVSEKLGMLLEAARRANWDALHGPKHLRSGRYRPDGGSGAADPMPPTGQHEGEQTSAAKATTSRC